MTDVVMKHVLSYSGGKDSTAMYLLAMEIGFDFLPIFADTGNEHDETLEYTRLLPERTGGPEIRWVKADFTADIERKRRFIAEKWPKHGVPQKFIERALAVLQPTGIPFLDLCMWKGRFPSTKARFCSEELKHHPIFYQVIDPLMEAGHEVISWQGVRADESENRSKLDPFEEKGGGLYVWRPLLRWTWQDVFDMHARHGIEPNPLYRLGMGRVGCMPCIHARKAEIREISERFPEHVDRIEEWERIVGECSKHGLSSFFPHNKTPGEHVGKKEIQMPGIREVVEWSKTTRGGRQYGLLEAMEDAPQCSSLYGLCE